MMEKTTALDRKKEKKYSPCHDVVMMFVDHGDMCWIIC
jgi:hypothetical protein